MKKYSIIAMALCCGISAASAANDGGDEARLLRFPTVGGSTIVFSY